MASTLLILFVMLLCSCCSIVVAAGRFAVVPSSSFEPATVCSTPRGTSGPNRATVPLVHRHGPCAPSFISHSQKKPSLAERLRADRARRAYITSKATASSESDAAGVSIPTYLGDAVDSLEYVVTVSLGTPAVPQVVLIDTGSDLSWVQCQPCNATECYPQKDPLFDPSKSSSYATVPCGTDACKKLAADGYDNGCTGTTNSSGSSLCGYGIQYGDGSTTTGVYSTETLTLAPGVAVRNFSFGCGDHQRGPEDRFDGLLGLGGAPESLVSQTAQVYGGAFSYCLPPVNGSSGFLSLGGGGGNNTAGGFVYTPMHGLPGMATFYVVALTGISVGGEPLAIPPSVFSPGMIVDSGTVVTGLPETAYAALRTAFRSAMSRYPLLPPSPDGLDTCYNLTGLGNVTVPRVALTFSGGATIDLDVPSGVLLDGCLAFVGAGRDNIIGIIGNVNQRTFEVSYDSAGGKVGFRAGAC